MFLSNISTRKPVMTTMIILGFILFGVIAMLKLPVSLMPDVNIPYVLVQTIYPGAGPTETETQVSEKIEEVLSTISGIDFIESYSMDNASMVVVKFKMSKDTDIANQEVKDKINTILSDLPADANTPTVEKFEFGAEPIIQLILSGDIPPTQMYDLADNFLKDRFYQVEGVAKVDLSGGQEREIQIETTDRILFENQLSLAQFGQYLSMNNLDFSGGHFTRKMREYSLRTDAEFKSIQEIENMKIPTASGYKTVKELAEVKDTVKEVRKRSIYFNSKSNVKDSNVIKLGIIKASDGNTVSIARNIKKMIPKIQKDLPEGVNLEMFLDDSEFIKNSIKDTFVNLLLGIFLTGLILFFFLHDIRSTLIVAVSMPASIISSFMVLSYMGFSLNMMTLMGLSTAVGVLVSNSIVVLENIFRHNRLLGDRGEAARVGAAEVTSAVMASTATNLVVFLPIANMSSMVGMFFKEFALTVSVATVFSLFMSFTLTPMLASIMIPKKEKHTKFGARIENFLHWLERLYHSLLSKLLSKKKNPILLMVTVFAIFFIVLFTVAPKIGFSFFPDMDEGNFSITVELPQGYSLSQSAETLGDIEKIITSNPEVEMTLTTIGDDTGTHKSAMTVIMVPADEREVKTYNFIGTVIKQLSNVPNAIIAIGSNQEDGGSPIQFYIQHSDRAVVEKLGPIVKKQIETVPGMLNFDTSLRGGKPELVLHPKREELAQAGISAYELGLFLKNAAEGVTPTIYRTQGQEYDIRLSLTNESIDTPEEVENLTVITPTGRYTISQLADITFGEGPTQIRHRNKVNSIEFSASPAAGVPLNDVVLEIKDRLKKVEMPSGTSVSWAGQSEMMTAAMLDFAFAFLIAIILVYMLLASLLESFTRPFIILVSLPLATIGVFILMYVSGQSMNIISMMSIIMLIGLVVNDAILIVDYTNQVKKKKKIPLKEAILIAAPTKMKTVLMTTLAIQLGMLPMALGIGTAGAEYRIPMAIIQIGGMMTSTVLTLFLIPGLYLIAHRDKD